MKVGLLTMTTIFALPDSLVHSLRMDMWIVLQGTHTKKTYFVMKDKMVLCGWGEKNHLATLCVMEVAHVCLQPTSSGQLA